MKSILLNCSIAFTLIVLSFSVCLTSQAQSQEKEKTQMEPQLWCTYPGGEGVGKGKHIVLISGDDEYRSEEALPMLGKILSVHHGFKCTVLFAIDPADNTIKPNHQTNIPGMEAIDSADLIVLGLRFRNLPNDDMKHFVDHLDAGKPIIGLRTSTHAFNFEKAKDSDYKHFSWRSKEKDWEGGFGQQVFGETWHTHHGHHGHESTRGVIADANKDNAILNGVSDVWGPTDVYGVIHLPDTATVLLKGAVIENMEPTGKPVKGEKNDPMMPLAWTKGYKSKSGKENRIFCTTMGAATDFECEDLRRLVVNACLWSLEMEDKIPEKSNVELVGEYKPTPFGFKKFKKGTKPADYNLK